MKKEHIYFGIGLSLIVIGGLSVYKKYFSMSREEAIKIIENFVGAKYIAGNTYDTAFLVSRAYAIKDGEEQFVYQSKSYSTRTSKAIVK